MRQIISILAVSTLLAVAAAAKDAQSDKKTINDYETALGEAMIHRDIATLEMLVGDDWTMQSESGKMGTKAGFINDVKSGALVVTTFKLHDLRIRVVGDMAFVQAFDDEVSAYNGKSNSGTYNWMDVWERRDERWVSVATQLTRVNVR